MIYVVTFLVLALFFVFMGVGVIFSNKRLKGSCGGLGQIMGEDCAFCSKKDKCEKAKHRVSC